jgi:hypothetical protein
VLSRDILIESTFVESRSIATVSHAAAERARALCTAALCATAEDDIVNTTAAATPAVELNFSLLISPPVTGTT